MGVEFINVEKIMIANPQELRLKIDESKWFLHDIYILILAVLHTIFLFLT